MSPDRRPNITLRFAAVLAGCVLLALPLIPQQGPALPAAPIEPKVKTACAECHDTQIVLQQRLSRATWTKEVDKMIRWGAVVDPADREAFIAYLSTNFPPDKAPFAPPGAAKAAARKQ